MMLFLPERDYVTFEYLLSQIRLSVVYRLSVCNVRAPDEGVELITNIFFTAALYTLATLWLPCVGALNAREVIYRAILDLPKAISYRYKIRLRVQLMTNRK